MYRKLDFLDMSIALGWLGAAALDVWDVV